MDTDPDAETIEAEDEAAAAATILSGPGEQSGAMIGRYKLLQPLGEGGMGTVWMAEQREPMVRRVALKIIKLGMETQEVVGRFEQERQALALMDHPCIARVFDAGTTESGRPYFVMELVRGVPLTAHCDEQKLGVSDRLAIFIQVCQAVQHAHQKGIIHRDLKPSNILVTAGDDGEPLPKVIDFGIAKATGRALTDKTLFTQLAQIIGTPAYMSPEQAGTGPLDIDTRSDIYSLGVLLYELLTGRPPFDPRELISAGLDEMRRVIREKEPPKPSTRISSLSEKELTGLAAHCSAPAPRIVAAVRGDLDWIVMKALDKNRNRRYESATGLAHDIQRHMEDQPVLARSPSKGYLLSRFVRRHKFGFAAGAAVALALVSGITAAIWGMVRVEAARKEAKEETAKATIANLENEKNLYLASIADLASAMEVCKQTFKAEHKGERVVGLAGRLGWREAVALLARSLERDMENQRSAIWLYEILRHRGTLKRDCRLHLLKHEACVWSASFSADGTKVFTASADGTLQVWNAATGQSVSEPRRLNGELLSASFSADSKKLVTGSKDGTVRIWDSATGNTLGDPIDSSAWKIFFSHDGTRFVTVSTDATGGVWDSLTGHPIGEPKRHHFQGLPVSFSPDGARFVTVTTNIVQVRETGTDQPIGEPLRHEAGILSASFSPDGTRVVTGSDDKTAAIWDARTGQHLGELMKHDARLNSADFSPDGTRIVTASEDRFARLWDAETGRPLGEPMEHAAGVQSARFSPDGNKVVTASSDGTAAIWDTETVENLGEPLRHDNGLTTASFSPDGTKVAIALSDGALQIWDVTVGQTLGNLIRHENGKLRGVCFTPDGTKVIAACEDGSVCVWDATTGAVLGELMRYPSSEAFKCFSPDRAKFVTSGEGSTAWIRNSATGVAHGEPMQHTDGVLDAKFNQDGLRLVTASWDKSAQVWDVATGHALGQPMRHWDGVLGASFSPDSTKVATASLDKTVRVWDAATGDALVEPMHHEAAVTSVTFSPDGTSILTTSWDGTARVWDPLNGQPCGKPMRHDGAVEHASFSTDGSRIVTACSDGTARLWEVLTTKESVSIAAITHGILAWAKGIAGVRYNDNGELQLIPDVERIAIFSTPDLPAGPWADLAKWINTPAPHRTIDVKSKFSLRQIAERERDFHGDGNVESLNSALQYDPTVPLARLLLAAALEREDATKEAKDRDPRLPQHAAFLRRYDLDSIAREEGKMKREEMAALCVRAGKHLIKLPPDTKIGVDYKPTTAREEAVKAAQKAAALAPDDAAVKEFLKQVQAAPR